MNLHTQVGELTGVGPARVKGLARLGIQRVEDLLQHLPRDYEDRTRVYTINTAPVGEGVCISAMVAEEPRLTRVRRGMDLVKVRAVDASGTLWVTFFNQTYVKDALKVGQSYIFYGMVEGGISRRTMTNPLFEGEGVGRFTGRIVPIYPLTAGISNHILGGLVSRCLDDCLPELAERLPQHILDTHQLVGRGYAVEHIHRPESPEHLDRARRRLSFEELFYFFCGLAQLKGRRKEEVGPRFTGETLEEFTALLPFTLTGAQRRAMEEMVGDMTTGRPMNRLVQGDVGSGKTMVAAYGAWIATKNGYQSALMAPTEILAEQHHRTLSTLFASIGLRVGLLTASLKVAEKRKVLGALAAGELDLVIGTHALLSEGVTFAKLGLVIADEQHRFGVAQRATLSEKAGEGLRPHLLVMSATPIPRTLALILYGDLDVSVIDELPAGRTPVESYIIGEDKRQRMYNFVRKLVGEGRQVYIVCPMVQEGEEATAELKAVTVYAETLGTQVFPDLKVGLVHGKMKAREKDAVMSAFSAGEMDILVATTVIEVGVDVPNAALMVIENAERFGLSQLHQLRGRVGRGGHQSYCVLMSATRNEDSRARLKVLASTTDGFKIAEEDLKLRGPGDFFGKRQHGLPALHVADLAADMRILKEAQGAAEALLAEHPALEGEIYAPLRQQVAHLFQEQGNSFN